MYRRHNITVDTDNQPLETIFKKPLCKAPQQLQQMMLKLQRHQFSVQYKKGKELYIPNTLSHAPVTNHPSKTSARKEFEVFPMELAEMDIETIQ